MNFEQQTKSQQLNQQSQQSKTQCGGQQAQQTNSTGETAEPAAKSTELARALRLYAVTDNECLQGRTLPECVEEVIAGGATMIQYRNKHANDDPAFAFMQASAIRLLCSANKVPFIVNDDIALAKRVEADGVHVGQGDMSCEQARKKLGQDAIIGVSAQTVKQALAAQKAGADYLGVGAMITTSTKPDAEIVSMDTLSEIVQAVDIPVVAIGGINAQNVSQFAGSGIAGVAVVSAVFGASVPKDATQELANKVQTIC